MPPVKYVPDDDQLPAGEHCPICEAAAGDCDHLVVSIDRTFSEITAGAIFARGAMVVDLMERLAAAEPDLLKVAGAGPALEHVATMVAVSMEEGMSPGDAVAVNLPQVMSALSYMLQETGDVSVTDVDVAHGEGSSFEHLWAEDPEGVVDRLVERLQEVADEVAEEP